VDASNWSLDQRLIAEELLRRREARRTVLDAKICFPAQLEYVLSDARRNVATCSRRAGKTYAEAVRLLRNVFSSPYANQLYATTELRRSRRLIWPYLRALNSRYKLGGEVNETEAFMRFPHIEGCPHIFLGGAKDASEMEKIKGYAGGFKLAVVDEFQDFRPGIARALLEQVIEPSLMDWDGTLDVLGTPGASRSGPYWDIWSNGDGKHTAWRRFSWTVRENAPLLKQRKTTADELLAKALEDHGWTTDDPTYRRHYLGQWSEDPNALVFRYDAARNDYTHLPPLTHYVMGVDLGYHDQDAVAVLGWHEHSKDVYLVAEYTARREGYTDLIERGVNPLFERYRPTTVWWDFGGQNVKAQEEIRRRWPHLPSFAAEKSRKLEFVALLNDALRTGRLKAKSSSVFAQECAIVQWEKPHEKISPDPHGDMVDAVLYAYRASLAYLSKPPEVTTRTPETDAAAMWADMEERETRADLPWMRGI
jgi:hypothetical protein